MVRKIKKRKLEEITSDSRNKLQVQLSKTDKANANQLEDEGNSLFITDSPRKSKNVKDDDDNDENHTESQSFLAMVVKQSQHNKQAAKASKEFLRDFIQKIGNSTNNLKSRVQYLNHLSVKRDNDFLFSFQTVYRFARPSYFHHNSKKQEFSFASLQSSSEDLISRAQRAVEVFESVSRIKISMECMIKKGGIEKASVKWNKEMIETEDLLKLGRQVGLERYNALIRGDNMKIRNYNNDLVKKKLTSSSLSSDPALVDSLLYESDENVNHDGASWGTVAQKQLHALKKLVKVT